MKQRLLTPSPGGVTLPCMLGRTHLFQWLICLALAVGAPAFAQSEIDWNAARDDAAVTNPADIAWPVNRDRAALDEVRVPVLLPASNPRVVAPGRGPGVLFFPRGDTYVASFEINDVSVELIGSGRPRFSIPDGAPPALTGTDAGAEANFSRYGAGYTVSVSCPDAAQRECADPDFIRRVIASLAVAGGAPD